MKHQQLSCFLSFLLHCYLFLKKILHHKKDFRLVQWVIWYEEFVVKNGLHATAN